MSKARDLKLLHYKSIRKKLRRNLHNRAGAIEIIHLLFSAAAISQTRRGHPQVLQLDLIWCMPVVH